MGRRQRAGATGRRAGLGHRLSQSPETMEPAVVPLSMRIAKDEVWRPTAGEVSAGNLPAQ